MSLAQPTLDLLMLEQISELKNTLEKLNASILTVNESVNEKLNLLNEKVDKQDVVIQKLLASETENNKNDKLSSEISVIDDKKLISCENNIDINDKNIKLNRKEIENLYRVVNTYKDENKEVVKEIDNIKTKMEVLSDNSSKNSIKIMDTLNGYITELKSHKHTPVSYANATQNKPVDRIENLSNTSNNHHSYHAHNRRNTYNSYSRYSSPKNKETQDEDGWQTVKNKKKSSNFKRY